MWNLPDQVSNPCCLHWQAGPDSLDHQGTPTVPLWLQTRLFSLVPGSSSAKWGQPPSLQLLMHIQGLWRTGEMGGKVLGKVSALGMLLNSLFFELTTVFSWEGSGILGSSPTSFIIQVSPKPWAKRPGFSEASFPAVAQWTTSGGSSIFAAPRAFKLTRPYLWHLKTWLQTNGKTSCNPVCLTASIPSPHLDLIVPGLVTSIFCCVCFTSPDNPSYLAWLGLLSFLLHHDWNELLNRTVFTHSTLLLAPYTPALRMGHKERISYAV